MIIVIIAKSSIILINNESGDKTNMIDKKEVFIFEKR